MALKTSGGRHLSNESGRLVKICTGDSAAYLLAHQARALQQVLISHEDLAHVEGFFAPLPRATLSN